MSFRFPIKEVTIVLANERRTIEHPRYKTDYLCITQSEFILNVENLAWFYARNGDHIEVRKYSASDPAALELYLNGSVYGAILHQRKILPFHGSCFQYDGRGIMICGESGVGKSSLTAAFCIKGAEFLTDDVTPIVFTDEVPHVWVMSDRIKLWSDSLQQLNQKKENLVQVGSEWAKFYFPMESIKGEMVSLNHIFVLTIHDKPGICIEAIEGLDKFIYLRNEIYRSEYLRGMPESEICYLKQLIALTRTVLITKVSRPALIPIEVVRVTLEKYILGLETNSISGINS